jgi:hypothetical protein
VFQNLGSEVKETFYPVLWTAVSPKCIGEILQYKGFEGVGSWEVSSESEALVGRIHALIKRPRGLFYHLSYT